MRYFDTHAHYYDDRFYEEYEGSVDELIEELLSDSVSYIINVGTSPETSRLAIGQAKKFDRMYTAVGIHPSDTRFLSDMERELQEIRALIEDKESKCVALGEIGLDYHYEGTDREKQMRYFEAQMSLAQELGIPVVIHDREAHGDIMSVIRKYPAVKGVLHSYSGSVETAEELVRLGYMISMSGTVTFTNAKVPKEVVKALPKDKILIETDSPYLSPHPKRGTLNNSSNLKYTNAKVAELLGISEQECARLTEANAKRTFGIK